MKQPENISIQQMTSVKMLLPILRQFQGQGEKGINILLAGPISVVINNQDGETPELLEGGEPLKLIESKK